MEKFSSFFSTYLCISNYTFSMCKWKADLSWETKALLIYWPFCYLSIFQFYDPAFKEEILIFFEKKKKIPRHPHPVVKFSKAILTLIFFIVYCVSDNFLWACTTFFSLSDENFPSWIFHFEINVVNEIVHFVVPNKLKQSAYTMNLRFKMKLVAF